MTPTADIRWHQRLSNFELSWETTKDYMEANGFLFAVVIADGAVCGV